MPNSDVSSSPDGPAILLLDDAVINGIAAGEVIERPASAVKELVENALDAAATTIEVRYDDHDRIDISVSDDGHGIAAVDLLMAVQRHATSKLRTLHDLTGIRTFGFRGEALASMATVADIEIISRTRGAAEASGVRVRSGGIVERFVAGHRAGTRVVLADVFGGVPVRKKFLKAVGAEFAAVADTMRRFALLHPEVGFRLLRNGRPALELPGVADLSARLRQVLDAPAVATLHAVEARHGGMILTGVLSAAGESYGSGRRMFLFVNGRWVQDRTLFRAVMEGYRTYLMRGRYPAAALFLELPGDRLDVNVHPAKLEVRFVDADVVQRFVSEAIAETLRTCASPLGRWGMSESQFLVSQIDARRKAARAVATPASDSVVSDVVAENDVAIPGYRPSRLDTRSVGSSDTARPSQIELAPRGDAPLRVIGQAFRGYILCEREGELVLIDQHAAHERVLYERLVARLEGGRIESQPLLTAVPVRVGGDGAEAIERARGELDRAGWEIDRLGDEDVVVRAVPLLCVGRAVDVVVERLGTELAGGGSSSSGLTLVREVLATVACHAATRVGQILTPEQQRALIEEVGSVDFASSCPHGRPVSRTLARARVERMFGR